MAANFGYDEEYVDEKLDMERLFAHLEYLRECPPPGMLIKAYFEAQAGESSGGGSSSSYTPTTPPPKKEFKTEEERRNYEKTILNNLCADFGVNVNQLQPMPKRKIRVLPSKLKKGGKS
jgi:hypothetical protein